MPEGIRALRISPGVLAGDSNHTSGTGLVRVHTYRKGVSIVRILIPGSKLNSQEQLEMAKYLVKAGYAVSITKGKSQSGKAVSYINYNIVEVQDEQTQKRDKPCGGSPGD